MLVAISGSQGSGKTTILNMLEEKGCLVIKRKTSRSILEDWGVSLQDVNESPDLTTKFQDEITKRKFNDEITEASLDNRLYFTERTHADLFTYTVITLGLHNTYSDWLNDYYEKCLAHCQIYDLVYFLRAGHFVPEHDGTRGSNPHYSRLVDLTMLDLTQQMIHPSKLSVIETPVLEQRVQMILRQSENLLM